MTTRHAWRAVVMTGAAVALAACQKESKPPQQKPVAVETRVAVSEKPETSAPGVHTAPTPKILDLIKVMSRSTPATQTTDTLSSAPKAVPVPTPTFQAEPVLPREDTPPDVSDRVDTSPLEALQTQLSGLENLEPSRLDAAALGRLRTGIREAKEKLKVLPDEFEDHRTRARDCIDNANALLDRATSATSPAEYSRLIRDAKLSLDQIGPALKGQTVPR